MMSLFRSRGQTHPVPICSPRAVSSGWQRLLPVRPGSSRPWQTRWAQQMPAARQWLVVSAPGRAECCGVGFAPGCSPQVRASAGSSYTSWVGAQRAGGKRSPARPLLPHQSPPLPPGLSLLAQRRPSEASHSEVHCHPQVREQDRTRQLRHALPRPALWEPPRKEGSCFGLGKRGNPLSGMSFGHSASEKWTLTQEYGQARKWPRVWGLGGAFSLLLCL